MKLTVGYTAPLPPGFQSGTLELRSQTVYVDKDGLVNQPYYQATINPDRGLPNVQNPAQQLQVVGMGQGDPSGASPLDVVVTMVVTGLPTPLRSTFRVIPTDTGGGALNLHLPAVNVPLVGPPDQGLKDLLASAQVQAQQVNDALDMLGFGLTLIPPAAQDARDAALAAYAAAGGKFVKNEAERTAYLNGLTGDGVAIQLDTHHVWRKLGGLIEDLGPNTVYTPPAPVIVYLPYNTVKASMTRLDFQDGVISVGIFDNSYPHGFDAAPGAPTHGRILMDRSGSALTTFGQVAFDVQDLYEYDTTLHLRRWGYQATSGSPAPWSPWMVIGKRSAPVGLADIGVLVAPLNGQGLVPPLYLPAPAPFTRDTLLPVLQAGRGVSLRPTGQTAVTLDVPTGGLLPRLTGGTPGNFVIATPVGWSDALTSHLTELGNGVKLALLCADGSVRDDGIGTGYEGLHVGDLVYLADKTKINARNWYTVSPSAPQPAPTTGQAVVRVGVVVARDAIAPTPPVVTFPVPVSLPQYPDGFAADPTANYSQPLLPLSTFYESSNGNYTSGHGYEIKPQTPGRLAAFQKSASVPVGGYAIEAKHDGANAPDYFLLDVTGAAGSETGYALQVATRPNGKSSAQLGRWVGSNAAGAEFVGVSKDFPLLWLAQNGLYSVRLAWQGTRLAAGVFQIGAAFPGYQIELFMDHAPTGVAAVGLTTGVLTLGNFDLRAGPVAISPSRDLTNLMLDHVDLQAPWNYVSVGDSMNENLHYNDLLSALEGGDVLTLGIGGQQSAEISGRVGGRTATFSVAGGVIPKYGEVQVTPTGPDILRSATYDRQATGYLDGVYGRLRYVGGVGISVTGGTPGTYFFQRAGTGKPQAVVGDAIWQGNTEFFKDRKVLIWMGRNDASSPDMTTTVLKAVTEIWNAVIAAGGIPFVLSVLYGDYTGERSTETPHPVRDRIDATNAALHAFAGDAHYIDIVSGISTDPNGLTPANLRYDGLHPNDAGYDVIVPTYVAPKVLAINSIYT